MRWRVSAARSLLLFLGLSVLEQAASSPREVPFRRDLRSSADRRETSSFPTSIHSKRGPYRTSARRWLDSVTFADKYHPGRKKRDADSTKMIAQVTDDQEPLFSLEKFDTIDTRLLESFIRPYKRQEEDFRDKRKIYSHAHQDSYSSVNNRKSSERSRASSRSIQSSTNGPRNKVSNSAGTRNPDRNIRLELRDTRNMLKLLHGMPSEFKKRFTSLLLHSDRSGLSELVREMIAFHMGSGNVREVSVSKFKQVSVPPTVSRGKSVSTPRTTARPQGSPTKNNFLPSFQFNSRQGDLEESVSSKETAAKLPVIESAVILHRELIREPGRVIIPLNGRTQKQEKKKTGPFQNIHWDFVPSNNPLAKITTAPKEKNRNTASSSSSQNQSGKRNRNKVQNTRILESVPLSRIPSTMLENNNFGNMKQPRSRPRQKDISQSSVQAQQGFDTDEFSDLLEQIRHSPAFDRIMRNILSLLKAEQKLAEITVNENDNKGKSIGSDSTMSNNDANIDSSISSQDLFQEPASSVFISRINESNAHFNDLLEEASPNFIPEDDILHGEILEDGLTTIENRINAEIKQSTMDLSFDSFSSPDQSFPPSSANLVTNDNTVASSNSAVNQQSNDFSSNQFVSSSAGLIPNENTFAPGNSGVNLQSDDFTSSQFPPSSGNLVPNDNNFGSGNSGVNRHSDDFIFSQSPITSANFVPNSNVFATGNPAVNLQSENFSSSQFPQFNPSQADPRLPPAFSTASSGFPNLKPKRIVPLSTDLGGQFFEDDIVNFRQQTTGSSTAKENFRDEDQFSFDDQVNFVPLSTDFDGQLDGFPLQDPITSSGNAETSLSGGGTLPEDIILFNDPISEVGPDDDFGLAIGDFAHRPFESLQSQGNNQRNNFQLDGSGVQLQNTPVSAFSPAPGFPVPGGVNNPFLSSSGVDTSTNNLVSLPPNNVDGFASGSIQSVLEEAGTFRENFPSQSTSDIFSPETNRASSPVTFGDIMNSQSSSESDKEFIFPNHSPEISIMSDSLPSQSTSDFRSFGETPPGSSFAEDFLTGDFINDDVSLHDFEFTQSGQGERVQPVGIPLPGLNRSMSEIRGTSHTNGVPLSETVFQQTNFNNNFPNSGIQSVGVPLPSGNEFTQSGQGQRFQPVGIPLPGLNRSMSEIRGISQSIGVPLPGIGSQQTNFNIDFSNPGSQSVGVPLPSGSDSASTTFGNQFGLSNQGNIPTNFELDNDSVETGDSFEIRDSDSLESDERLFLQKDFGPASQAFKNNLSSFSYDAVDETGYPEENVSKNHRFVTFLTPGLIYPYSAKDAVYQGGSGFVQQYNVPQQYIYPSQGYNVPQVFPHQYLQPSINSGYRVPNGYKPPAALAPYDGRRTHKHLPSSTYTAPPPVLDPYNSGHNPCLSRTVVLTTILIKDKPPSVTTILDRVTSVHMVDRYFVSPVTVLQPYSPNTATYNNNYGGSPLTYSRTDPPSRVLKLPDYQYESGAPSQIFGLAPEIIDLLHEPDSHRPDPILRPQDRQIRHAKTVGDSDKTIGDDGNEDKNNTQTKDNSTVEVIRLKAFQYVRRRRSASAEGAHIHKLEPYAQMHTKTIAATAYTPEPRYIMDQTVHVGQPAPQMAYSPQPQVDYTPQPQVAYTPQLQVDYNSDVVARAGHYSPVSRMIKSTFFRTLSTKVPTTIVATRSLVSTISYGQTLTTIRSTSVFCIEPAPNTYYAGGVSYQGASMYNPQVGTPPLPLYTQNVASSYNAPVLLPHATYPNSPPQFRTWVGSLMDDDNASDYDGVPNKFVLLQHMWPKAFVYGDGISEGYTKINLSPGNPYVGGVNRRLELPMDYSSDSSVTGKSLVTIHQPLIQSSLRH